MLKKIVLLTVIFLFPLFFLPFTNDFFITNKLYLLALAALVLLLESCLQFLKSKKLVWYSRPLDWPVFFLVLAVTVSSFLTSPNQTAAILNPGFGLVTILSLSVLYFYLSRSNNRTIEQLNSMLILSAVLLSLSAIVFFFHPFKFIPAGFNLMGNRLNLAIFLGFSLLVILNGRRKSKNPLKYPFLVLVFLAVALTGYSLFKQPPLLPPFDISWYAALETLKSPLTALFGVGPDNFGYLFTQAKTVAYNQTALAQVDFFTISRSALLHILSVTGLVGFISFLTLLVKFYKQKSSLVLLVYLLICSLLFPISLPIMFLFFFTLATIEPADNKTAKPLSLDLSKTVPAYLLITIAAFAFVAVSAYFLGQNYLAEYYFGKAMEAYNQKKNDQFVNGLVQAINLNPNIDKYHLALSQVYLANFVNDVKQISQNPKGNTPSDQEQKNLDQAAQAAVAEAKNAINLNQTNSGNWAYLGSVYRNIASVNNNVLSSAVSAYQNAILLDPKNPAYYQVLSGIFYTTRQYDEATRFAEQAIDLKSTAVDPYYSAAWSSFQLGYVQKAVNLMQNIVNSIDKKKNKNFYDQAQKDLATFKSKLPTPTPTPKL